MAKRGAVFLRYCRPIRDVLVDKGGSGTAAEVTEEVVTRLQVPETELAETLKDGSTPKVYNAVAWARFYMVKAGLIDSSRRGIWTLTEKGRKADLDDATVRSMFRQVREEMRKDESETISDPADDVDEEPIDPTRHRLISRLLKLSPTGFERICRRLLLESGFEKVEVTRQSGDGGIDGHGILQVNPFVSFTVMFQCKRYQKAVSSPTVRDFRGAMQGRADKGIILTTGTFTADAIKEARRDGVPPIELIAGDDLVELFVDLELGLTPRTVYEIDDAFFDQFDA